MRVHCGSHRMVISLWLFCRFYFFFMQLQSVNKSLMRAQNHVVKLTKIFAWPWTACELTTTLYIYILFFFFVRDQNKNIIFRGQLLSHTKAWRRLFVRWTRISYPVPVSFSLTLSVETSSKVLFLVYFEPQRNPYKLPFSHLFAPIALPLSIGQPN